MTGGMPQAVGSSAILCLDPTTLPVRYEASDARADSRSRVIEIFREGVILRRRVGGLDMNVRVPLHSFRGVAVRYMPGDTPGDDRLAVLLEHSDPGLTVPLYMDREGEDILYQWRMWAKSLACPLLFTGPDGEAVPRQRRLGALAVGQAYERRRRRTALKKRHSAARLLRRTGHSRPTPVHTEVEMIARALED